MEAPDLPQGLEEPEDGASDQNGAALEVLRSSWEFAAILSFARIFAAPLSLRPFSGDLLEAALLNPDDHNMFLSELLFKLLRKDTREPYTEREAYSYEEMLRKKLEARWAEAFTANPLKASDFYTVDAVTRVRPCPRGWPALTSIGTGSDSHCGAQMSVLWALVQWRLDDCPAVREAIKQAVSLGASCCLAEPGGPAPPAKQACCRAG
jgi:hypothetical protein